MHMECANQTESHYCMRAHCPAQVCLVLLRQSNGQRRPEGRSHEMTGVCELSLVPLVLLGRFDTSTDLNLDPNGLGCLLDLDY